MLKQATAAGALTCVLAACGGTGGAPGPSDSGRPASTPAAPPAPAAVVEGWGPLTRRLAAPAGRPPAQRLADCGRGWRPEFRVFTAGPAVGPLRRNSTERRCRRLSAAVAADPGQDAERHRDVYVSSVYGSCDSGGDVACAPPGEVQSLPACESTPGASRQAPDGPPFPFRRLRVRGAPAAAFEDRLEIYTGTTTVVLYGDERFQRTLAGSLRSDDGEVGAGDPLPLPVRGVLDDRLTCAYGA